MSGYKLDDGTKKGIYFALGVLLTAISVINFNKSQILAIMGVLLGIFFIVKALS